MKRIDLLYGGQRFSISGRDYDDVRTEILAAVAAGGAWLTVNVGEGSALMGHILVTSGVSLTVVPVTTEEAERNAHVVNPGDAPDDPPDVEL